MLVNESLSLSLVLLLVQNFVGLLEVVVVAVLFFWAYTLTLRVASIRVASRFSMCVKCVKVNG